MIDDVLEQFNIFLFSWKSNCAENLLSENRVKNRVLRAFISGRFVLSEQNPNREITFQEYHSMLLQALSSYSPIIVNILWLNESMRTQLLSAPLVERLNLFKHALNGQSRFTQVIQYFWLENPDLRSVILGHDFSENLNAGSPDIPISERLLMHFFILLSNQSDLVQDLLMNTQVFKNDEVPFNTRELFLFFDKLIHLPHEYTEAINTFLSGLPRNNKPVIAMLEKLVQLYGNHTALLLQHLSQCRESQIEDISMGISACSLDDAPPPPAHKRRRVSHGVVEETREQCSLPFFQHKNEKPMSQEHDIEMNAGTSARRRLVFYRAARPEPTAPLPSGNVKFEGGLPSKL